MASNPNTNPIIAFEDNLPEGSVDGRCRAAKKSNDKKLD